MNRVEQVYMKLKIQGFITPAEYELLIKDVHFRLERLEEKFNGKCENCPANKCEECPDSGRVEETPKAKQRTRRVSAKKVSNKGISEGAD